MRWLLAALLLSSCAKPAENSDPPAAPAGVAESRPAPAAEPASPPAAPAVPPAALKTARPQGALPAYIAAERVAASAEQARLIVYVGATWCEPCRRFHKALEQGKFAKVFEGIRFLEFDKDVHGQALDDAGYASDYIPLFAIPGTDGRSAGQHIEGSIKGPGAIGNIVPRLKKLLETP